jgi:hypothetical protein
VARQSCGASGGRNRQPRAFVALQFLQFCVETPIITYDLLFEAPQIVACLKRLQLARINGGIGDSVSLSVARQNWGVTGSGDKRLRAFVVLQFLKRFYVETRPV